MELRSTFTTYYMYRVQLYCIFKKLFEEDFLK